MRYFQVKDIYDAAMYGRHDHDQFYGNELLTAREWKVVARKYRIANAGKCLMRHHVTRPVEVSCRSTVVRDGHRFVAPDAEVHELPRCYR